MNWMQSAWRSLRSWFAPAARPGTASQGEVIWVDPAQLVPGPIVHEDLGEARMERIRELQAIFAEVHPQSVEQWADGFRRDWDPDRELAVWDFIARGYQAYCASRPLSLLEKRDVYALVLYRSMCPSLETLQRVKLSALTFQEAGDVLRCYEEANEVS